MEASAHELDQKVDCDGSGAGGLASPRQALAGPSSVLGGSLALTAAVGGIGNGQAHGWAEENAGVPSFGDFLESDSDLEYEADPANMRRTEVLSQRNYAAIQISPGSLLERAQQEDDSAVAADQARFLNKMFARLPCAASCSGPSPPRDSARMIRAIILIDKLATGPRDHFPSHLSLLHLDAGALSPCQRPRCRSVQEGVMEAAGAGASGSAQAGKKGAAVTYGNDFFPRTTKNGEMYLTTFGGCERI